MRKLHSESKFDAAILKAECRGACFLDVGGDAPPPPDYSPVANASREAAQISADLGREQLAEGKRQYDTNMAVAKPVVDAQLALMDQSKAQGDDYFNYMKGTFRPVEEKIVSESMAAGSAAEQEKAAGKAAAEFEVANKGLARQLARTGLRYGFSPSKLAAMAGSMGQGSALAKAGVMNTAREKEKTVGFAKRMDAAGVGRNLPGSSQGAYSLALNSGNSAVQNTMAPGAARMAAIGQGTNTILQGQGLQIQGLGSVLNAQTSYANANSGNDGILGGIGSAMGGLAAMKNAGFFSDRRLKENIEQVGVDERTGLNLYNFNYRGDPRRYCGVMADEVEEKFPEAVIEDDHGYKMVFYRKLGIEMREVA